MPPASRPRIHIRDAVLATDSAALTDIYFSGFSTTVIHKLLYPGGASPSARENYVRKLHTQIAESGSAATVFLKVAELVPEGDAEPVTVALARWRLVRRGREEEEEEEKGSEKEAVGQREGGSKVMTQEQLGEGVDLEVWKAFMGGIYEARARLMGAEPYLHLHSLVCHPSHRGLGAASALLRWGAELADREHLPAWLEASPYGYGLYRKFGFEDIEMLDVPLPGVGDGEDWGALMGVALAGEKADGCYRTAVMKRMPKV